MVSKPMAASSRPKPIMSTAFAGDSAPSPMRVAKDITNTAKSSGGPNDSAKSARARAKNVNRIDVTTPPNSAPQYTPARRMTALVGLVRAMMTVIGRRIATALVPPRPGRTLTTRPSTTPMNSMRMLNGCRAVPKPPARSPRTFENSLSRPLRGGCASEWQDLQVVEEALRQRDAEPDLERRVDRGGHDDRDDDHPNPSGAAHPPPEHPHVQPGPHIETPPRERDGRHHHRGDQLEGGEHRPAVLERGPAPHRPDPRPV